MTTKLHNPRSLAPHLAPHIAPVAEPQPKLQLHSAWLNSPLGRMLAIACDAGLCLLEFEHRSAIPKETADLERYLGTAPLFAPHPVLDRTALELEQYFARERRDFTVPLCTPGTPFQQRVWSQLRTIPFGSTRSYAAQALAIGNPLAVRAVAKANGENRVSIIIPCHRVIGSDGSLVGYGGGLHRKKKLLEHEGVQLAHDNSPSLWPAQSAPTA